MTLQNAIKRVEKLAPVKINGQFHTAVIGERELEFVRNGHSDTVATIRVRRLNDHDDSMSDYSAGSFFDNLSQALRFCEGK